MSTPEQNPLRIKFLKRLTELKLPPKTHPYLENWAESFMKAKAYRSAEQCHSYLSALSRSTRLADWQFNQAIQAARILASDLLNLPWANSFDWETLTLEAKDPSPNHRDLLRESGDGRILGLENSPDTICSKTPCRDKLKKPYSKRPSPNESPATPFGTASARHGIACHGIACHGVA